MKTEHEIFAERKLADVMRTQIHRLAKKYKWDIDSIDPTSDIALPLDLDKLLEKAEEEIRGLKNRLHLDHTDTLVDFVRNRMGVFSESMGFSHQLSRPESIPGETPSRHRHVDHIVRDFGEFIEAMECLINRLKADLAMKLIERKEITK